MVAVELLETMCVPKHRGSGNCVNECVWMCERLIALC